MSAEHLGLSPNDLGTLTRLRLIAGERFGYSVVTLSPCEGEWRCCVDARAHALPARTIVTSVGRAPTPAGAMRAAANGIGVEL